MFVISSILDLVQQKVNVLGTSPRNQFRDYFIRNRLEKLVPVINGTSRELKNPKTKPTNLFSNLDCLVKSGFPKNRDLSPAAPWGVYISRNDIKKTYFPIILANHPKTSFFDKHGFLFYAGGTARPDVGEPLARST